MLVLNAMEVDRLNSGDPATLKELLGIAIAENMRDATWQDSKKPLRRRNKLSPSLRLAMVHAGNLARK